MGLNKKAKETSSSSSSPATTLKWKQRREILEISIAYY